MCECYQVGGRFLTEDPDCPEHGCEAMRQRKIDEAESRAKDDRITELELRVKELEKKLNMLSFKLHKRFGLL